MPRKKAIEVVEPITEATTEQKAKRVFRSAEERLAAIDQKIAFHTRTIEQLEAKKSKIGQVRRTRKPSYAKVFAELKASGKTPEEILELLKNA